MIGRYFNLSAALCCRETSVQCDSMEKLVQLLLTVSV